MAALAGASQRFVQTKDQEREERLITEKLEFEERLLDKRIGAEAEQARLRRELDERIAEMQFGDDAVKKERKKQLPEITRAYFNQQPNFSSLLTYEEALSLNFIPSTIDKYDFYSKGAGAYSFNIPYNKDNPIASGKAILSTRSNNKSVYGTLLTVANSDDGSYTTLAKQNAEKILLNMDANLAAAYSEQYDNDAQKDENENAKFYRETWRKFGWDEYDPIVRDKLRDFIPNAIGLSKNYTGQFLPKTDNGETIVVKPDLTANVIEITGTDGNNQTYNIDKPDEIFDPAISSLMNKTGHHRGARPIDHYKIIKKELRAAVGDGYTKQEIAQMPFNFSAVMEETATVNRQTGQIVFNDINLVKAVMSGTSEPVSSWTLETTEGPKVNPNLLTGKKFSSFRTQVNVLAAGLDAKYIPTPLYPYLDAQVSADQIPIRLRKQYGIDPLKMQERSRAVTELIGVTQSMQTLLAGISAGDSPDGAPNIKSAETGLAEKITGLRAGLGQFIKSYITNVDKDAGENNGKSAKDIYGDGLALLLGTGGDLNDQAAVNQMMQFLTHVLVYNLARTLENPTGDGARLSQSDVENLASKLGFDKLFTVKEGQLATLQLIESKAQYEKDYINIMLTDGDPSKMMVAHALRNQVFTDADFMVPANLSYSTAATAKDRAFENISNFLPLIGGSTTGLGGA